MRFGGMREMNHGRTRTALTNVRAVKGGGVLLRDRHGLSENPQKSLIKLRCCE